MLARVASYGPVSVCPSVTNRCSIVTDERIELGFGTGASFHLSYTVLKEILVSPKIRAHPCYRLSSARWTLTAWQTGSSPINKVDNTPGLRQSTASLSQWSSTSVYSTIPSRGSIRGLATADGCLLGRSSLYFVCDGWRSKSRGLQYECFFIGNGTACRLHGVAR